MPSNHLILCRPLLLLPSIFPSIKVFSNESALPIKWPILEFQFQHHSFQWIFRTGWISLLSKGFSRVFLQHHSSKASILLCSLLPWMALILIWIQIKSLPSFPWFQSGATVFLTWGNTSCGKESSGLELLTENKTGSQAFLASAIIYESARIWPCRGPGCKLHPGPRGEGRGAPDCKQPGPDLPSHGGQESRRGWATSGLKP